ncbi:MAG: hypothetical protein IAF08_10415 [Rhizobacter sp.]|nr:hypothetical protein [Chlorobiales bacterium]
MANTSKKSQNYVETAMHEMKTGKLESGGGDKVTDAKQAIAIGLAEARKAGAKVPRKKPEQHRETGKAKSQTRGMMAKSSPKRTSR